MELEERRLAPVARSEEVARVDAHCLTTGCQERCAVISVICEVVKKFEGGRRDRYRVFEQSRKPGGRTILPSLALAGSGWCE